MPAKKTKQGNHWTPGPVVDWLFSTGCKMNNDREFVRDLGNRLNACGAPVDRLRIIIRTLHPEIVGAACSWSKATDATSRVETPRRIRDTDRYIGSPLQQLVETEETVRQRLDRLPEGAHRAYTELLEEGFTDYLAMPVITAQGFTSAIIIVTAKSDGFGVREVDNFHMLRDYLVPILEVQSLRHLAKSLLNTYVGKRTGEKVLAGMIKRGDADIINAALWFSDLRNFTRITETQDADLVLGMLNDYFEFVAAAVTARGGEILRFIGDAMLIVFPIDDKQDKRASCQAAIDAAIDAQSTLESLNHRRRRQGQDAIEFGVGLNVGEVIYGNVGAPDRLDFTVMGPAVNRTARLESLTKETGRNILFSKEFADLIDEPVQSLGKHDMKGIDEPQAVYALHSE
jgi:adenylate cyclase